MGSLFRLPDEVILTPLIQRFPGRDHQIRSLASLLYPDAIPCRNLVIHGTEATGKSTVTEQVLLRLSEQVAEEGGNRALLYATINAAQCITGRHLFECIVGSVADSVRRWSGQEYSQPRRCETLAQLAVALSSLLAPQSRDPSWKFVLVLDAIDRQRDGPPTLMPALARLSEIIPCLTCVFIVTAPPAGFLRTPSSPHLHFPPYTKPEFVRILSLKPPPPIPARGSTEEDAGIEVATQKETSDLWTRFCAAVYDSLIKSALGTLPSFQHSCHALWPRFTAPVTAGTYSPKEFSKLLIAARAHFQDESLLNPSIVSVRPAGAKASAPEVNVITQTPTKTGALSLPANSNSMAGLTALLPTAARLLLLSAYLASHNPTRHDLTLFSTYFHGRKRRRGGGFVANKANARSKHRKIARKLLGAQAFVLERMMAIFEAVRTEWVGANSSVGASGLDGDVGMAMATLSSLRLLVRVGTGDVMDRGGKWRINVGWEAIRGIGRSIGVDIEEWLIE
ncbi:Origin recognition complex subunit 5-like protein [Cladobotryum mycophilum]|uniref:Origin recognition complex subunit 5-like protein n=1 Tax=Cladobotryum mycophilum TaxID=491253 RepID=A0ABR0S953_9HYPO